MAFFTKKRVKKFNKVAKVLARGTVRFAKDLKHEAMEAGKFADSLGRQVNRTTAPMAESIQGAFTGHGPGRRPQYDIDLTEKRPVFKPVRPRQPLRRRSGMNFSNLSFG